MPINPFICVTFFVLLAGCRITGLNSDVVDAFESEPKTKSQDASAAIPAHITQELMPEFAPMQSNTQIIEEMRFDMDAQEVDARAFFQSLVLDTPMSAAIHPDVSGNISLNLKGVTLLEVLDVVKNMYGYEIALKGRLLQVYPAGVRTETFSVDYLSMQRMGVSMTSITSGGISEDSESGGGSGNSSGSGSSSNGGGSSQNLGGASGGGQQGNSGGDSGLSGGGKGTTIVTQNKNDFWKELEESLEHLVGGSSNATIIVNPHSGLVTVRAYPDDLRTIRDFLAQTETHIHRQVILEAKLVEVSLEDEYQQGINWQSILGHVGSTDLTFSTAGGAVNNVINGTIGGKANLTFLNRDFAGVINLLETQGDVQVLSSPRLTASNNQKAVIKVGTDEYFVTDVSTTTVTGAATTSSPNIQLEPFFSGIALDVTPQIDEDGSVILHVHPSVIETAEQTKVITLNEQGFELPLAQSTVRESDTIIRAKSGEIVVIGGLMQSQSKDIESKVPLLGDVPWLGELFTSKSEKISKKELVIMIRPIVVGEGTWTEQLKRSSDLLQSWYEE
ncbi:pilus (MSHA type) biogenesis protein MshL [Algibacillus agarilyticus]|uniref:pilus (MSHA type) biogenesis protein MshL n=1 Tax=Algibacillus agarilyticus TaxID=2234133 RepID=UPI000DCFE8F8|nr:pilus (MSHA type) biogenesis protein MshL [Algibacillus agarilyticus]